MPTSQETSRKSRQQSPPAQLSSTFMSSPTSASTPPTAPQLLGLASEAPPQSLDRQPHDLEASRRTLEARAAFTGSLHSVGQTVSADLRARAADLHANAHAIQKQEFELAKVTTELSKQNDQWDKVVDNARRGLKEIGDVQNWAEMLERDLLVVEEVLRLVEGGREAEEGEEEEDAGENHNGLAHYGGLEEVDEGALTEREDEDRRKIARDTGDVMDDVSSSASGITGTSVTTAGVMSDSSGKSSPPDQDGGLQQIKDDSAGDKKDAGRGGWWRWWW